MGKSILVEMIAQTPKPPYFAVVFTSLRTDEEEGYSEMAKQMVELASQQEGFLGVESAREEVGITVSYWKDLESISKWKVNTTHQLAQKKGREDWYKSFKVRIAKVECDYEM